MYDAVRLVDPVEKKVLDTRGPAVSPTAEICYNYWENGKICENCISIRAHCEGRSFVKLEKNPSEVFLVTAVPIECAEMPVVLELLQNTTETMLIGPGKYNEGELFRNFVIRMNDMVSKDPLTALYNRRFSAERLPVDIIEAEITGQPLSVCFLDLDNFKSINDTYGHEAGDLALQAVSGRIGRLIRAEHDWAARYGGDEFILCLKNTDKSQACEILGRIVGMIEAEPVDLPGGSVTLSISYGVESTEDSQMTAEELIATADSRMYQAKVAKSLNRRA